MIKEILNDNWKMKEVGTYESYNTCVPASVLSVLRENGVIEDPYYRDNEQKCRPFLEKDYEFTRAFTIAGDYLREDELDMIMTGIDTLADIYLNGQKIMCTDNMHRTYRFSLKDKVIPGSNELKFVFHSPLKYLDEYKPNPLKDIKSVPDGCTKGNQYLRKSHCSFGWDWGPKLPDMGILGKVEIEAYSKARIKEVYFDQIHENGEVKLLVDPVLYITDTIPLEIVVEVEGQKEETLVIRMPDSNEKDIPRGRNELTIPIVRPQLWWPCGMGEQKLYRVRIRVKKSDTIYDEKVYHIGLRTISVSTAEDSWGKEFAFVVNGVKMFAMGADYIPEDAVYTDITKERTEALIAAAAKSNFNCLRVWGGGFYPGDDFYDLCDKYGIVVWQDLMFACNVYDLTEHFEKNIVEEIKDNVSRIRHHACLGLWCGNNEMEAAWVNWESFKQESSYLKADYIKMFEYVIPAAIREADDKTFFWPSSPSSGGCFDDPEDENRGDAHYWEVWHGQKPFTEYRNHYFRFLSEFGFQSFPGLKTVETYTEPEDRNIFSYVMEQHQKNTSANGKILYYIAENFLYPSSFEGVLYVSQILQSEAIRYGVEHCRRNRGRCMGTLYWQFNDNWPVASWSSIDYYGRWKALQYVAKKFYEPLTGSLCRTIAQDGTVTNKYKAYVVNDSQDAMSVKVRQSLYDMKGKEIVHFEDNVRTLPGKVYELKEHDYERYVRSRGAGNVYLQAEFIFTDGRHRFSTETFTPYKHVNLLAPTVNYSVLEYDDAYEITVESDVFTPFVVLDMKDRDVVFEDNVFNVTAGKPYVVYLLKSEIKGEPYKDVNEFCRNLDIFYLQKSYMQFETYEPEDREYTDEADTAETDTDKQKGDKASNADAVGEDTAKADVIGEKINNENTEAVKIGESLDATGDDYRNGGQSEDDYLDDGIDYPEYKAYKDVKSSNAEDADTDESNYDSSLNDTYDNPYESEHYDNEGSTAVQEQSEKHEHYVLPRREKLDGIRIR